MSLHCQVCRLPIALWKNESAFCHLTQHYGKTLRLLHAYTEHLFVHYRSLLKWYRTANIWWTTRRCREDINFSICCNYVIALLHFCSASFQVHLQIIDRAWYYIYNSYCIYNFDWDIIFTHIVFITKALFVFVNYCTALN